MVTTSPSPNASRRFIKGASILTVSQLVVALCSFFRNIIIARHISVENFGIATTFALTLSLIEMTSNLALDRILIQDKEGQSDAMLASSHMLQFIRGLITGTILFFLANPIAHMFDLPHLAWAYQLIAIIPVIHGLIHWDMIVRQRNLDFFASSITDALPQLVTLALAYLASIILGDYRAMLVVICSQVFLMTLLSHLLARRPYRWIFQKDLIKKSLNFGWPLLINGLLMFAIFQGDRAVIGAMFTMETLGWYSTAFSLTLLPTLIFAKLSGNLLLPILSRSQEDPVRNEMHCILAVALCFCAGIAMVVFFSISGKAFIGLAFGEKYAMAGTVIGWLGIMQAIRTIRIAPTVISNSQARTKNAMYSNIFRSTALVLAIVFAYMGLSVEWVAVSGVIGETIAIFISFYLLVLPEFKRRLIKITLSMAGYSLAITVVVEWLAKEIMFTSSALQNIYLMAVGCAAGGIAALGICVVNQTAREQIYELFISLLHARKKPGGV